MASQVDINNLALKVAGFESRILILESKQVVIDAKIARVVAGEAALATSAEVMDPT